MHQRRLLLFLVLFITIVSNAQKSSSDLLSNFQTPPSSARPRVWWHWMNGNITKDGIRKDLEWMHRAGIGGFQNFDAALETPQIVPTRLIYMTPEWKEAFALATHLADSLKLEMAIAGSPGWSESGGAWVPVEDGMKKIVWTETRVSSGATNFKLPQAPASSGTFQNMRSSDELSNQEHPLPTLYKDVAVIAYPLAVVTPSIFDLHPAVTSSGGSFSLTELGDGDLSKETVLPADTVAGFGWIKFSFQELVTIQAVTIMGGGDRGFMNANGDLKESRWLEVSDDGTNFRKVITMPAGDVLQQTFSFPPVSGRYFRASFRNLPGNRQDPYPGTPIAELLLHTMSRVNRFEDKSAFAPSPGMLYQSVDVHSNGVSPSQVIDLTSKLRENGTLDWTVPSGKWCILRFGYTVMGTTNHPATPEATGFEVDKMDPVAIKKYFTHYLDMYQNATGGLMGDKGGLQFMVTDSWECGAQNWTQNMPQEFQKRRGYSMLPWMPVLAGYIVQSGDASDRFLFDFRKTIAEMTSEYHYDGLTDILKTYGMKRYSESHESGRALIADGMDVKRRSAVPMAAMWMPHPYFNNNDLTSYEADIRESASVAHIYGQNLVAAESLTTFGYGGYAWKYSPENLKPVADLELASGLNRFVIHCSPHQPVDDKFPGLGLGPFGQWFDRHETWAEQARAWTDYLSRSSYLLQQGKFVADIVYYYGEDDNITSLFKTRLPDIPEGYNFDFINSHALLHLLSVKNGKLVTPSGMSYRMLVIDSNARSIPMAVLEKLRDLVKGGAVIVGVKPEHAAGLQDDEAKFQKIIAEVFESGNPKVLTGISTVDALKRLAIEADFSYTKPSDSTRLLYVHRTLANTEIYWVNSRNANAQTLTASFRVTGKVPRIWHAETGKSEPASYSVEKDRTSVTLNLSPNDAVFVIFEGKSKQKTYLVPAKKEITKAVVEGSWVVEFQKDRGAPDKATLPKLTSLTDNSDPGIKYFSGTASYSKIINIQKDWIVPGSPLLLDLGSVKNLAEVIVNGKSLGIAWKKPFVVDIASAVKPGDNSFEIRVTNLWANRLIGDQQPGVTKKITYTTVPFYGARSSLVPSGLLGPVRIIQEVQE